MLNSRDIDALRSDVAANCRIWTDLCKAAGLAVLVTDCRKTLDQVRAMTRADHIFR